VSIWCAGSSEIVYAAVSTAKCPKCGKIVEVTARKHIKPHVASKITPTAPK
jgi:Zn finger protein HypA/HybF involved in hydrogenase expression